MRLKITLSVVLLLLLSGLLGAQDLEYGASLDTTYMMIGDQQKYTLKVRSDEGTKVQFPLLKDTLAKGVEIVSGPVRDSVKEKDGRWLVWEAYTITAFDSGVYVIPSLPIQIQKESYNNIVRTEPQAFVVNTYQVDEQKGNYDIAMPYQTPLNFREILPFLLWGLLILAVIGAIIWLIIIKKRNKPLFAREKEELPPYVVALLNLDKIKSEKLWQAGKEKEYYTQLTDTVRQYIDGELHIQAMEQTTFETVRALENCNEVDPRDREKLNELLQVADFVKFAKLTPLQDENAHNLEVAYDFVRNVNVRLNEEKEKERKKAAEAVQEKKDE